MSLIKANAVQIGQSGTATQNFTLAVPSSPDGTIKLARGNAGATTQDVLNVSNAGVVSFPQGLGNISNSTAIATGSTTARSLANRFADVVNVKDFGAVGDGVTDDTAAIQAALNSGRGVYFSNGEYLISNKITIANKSITITGENQTSTVIKFSSNAAGIDILQSGNNSVLISNIKILKTATPTNSPALKISGGGATISCWAYIENVTIYGAGSNYWNGGIWLDNISNSCVNSVNVDLDQTNSQYGFKVTGSSFTTNFDQCQSFSNQKGFIIEGDGEGVTINSCTIVNCIEGIIKRHTPTSEPLLVVTNSHINTNKIGIYLENAIQCFISNNLIYAGLGTSGPKTGWVGIDIQSTFVNEDISINNNMFLGDGYPSTMIGISLGWGLRTLIESNIFRNTFTGILLGSSATDTQIANNVYFGLANSVVRLPNAQDITNSHVFIEDSVLNSSNSVRALNDNNITMRAFTTTLSPEIRVNGIDPNINISLRTKGTGVIQFGTFIGSVDAPINGYITILDDAGNARKLATII